MKNENTKEILENLEKGVEEFFNSDKYIDYLNVMSKFHNYSANNQLLIAMQNPEASLVAGYKAWINNFDRHIVQGSKGIKILAPFKDKVDIETDKADENGNAIVEQKEYITFRPVTVFDVSQTEGKELPSVATRLTGSVTGYEDFMGALRVASPYQFNIMHISGEANGWCDYVSETIAIKEGMSQLQTMKTAVHEVAHGRVHVGEKEKSRRQKEVEAESIAYVVLSHYGFDTSEYSFGYVAVWAGDQDNNILKDSMNTIRNESKNIIDIIDHELEARTRQVNGMLPAEIESHAEALMKDTLIELGSISSLVGVKMYGVDTNGRDNPKVNVLAEYKGADREDDVFNVLHENKISIGNVELDINPIRAEKSGDIDSYYSRVKKWEREDMTDDSWPMVTVTYSSYPKIKVGKMNLYEAAKTIDKAEESLLKDNIKGNFVRLNMTYTYQGHKYENAHVITVGEGRKNFIDYLSLPVPVMTYMHRHLQLMSTVERAKKEDAISAKGTTVQSMYEDMMYEWAEQQRLKLNYEEFPEVEKPPEYNVNVVEKHKDWEMVR